MDPTNKDYHVGHEANAGRGIYTVHTPVEFRMMRIPGDMEKIWEHLIGDQFGVDSLDHPVLSTHCPISSSVIRTMTCEIFFEKLRVPSFHFAANAVL